MMKPRILIIGAGMVGSASAASITARSLGTVYLHDVVEDLSLGRAMDINHSLPCIVGDRGIRRVIEMELDMEEKVMLDVCARSITEQMRSLPPVSR